MEAVLNTTGIYFRVLALQSTQEYYSPSNVVAESNEDYPISEGLDNRIREALRGESISFLECFGEPL